MQSCVTSHIKDRDVRVSLLNATPEYVVGTAWVSTEYCETPMSDVYRWRHKIVMPYPIHN